MEYVNIILLVGHKTFLVTLTDVLHLSYLETRDTRLFTAIHLGSFPKDVCLVESINTESVIIAKNILHREFPTALQYLESDRPKPRP